MQNFTEIIPGEPLHWALNTRGVANRVMSRSGISSPDECLVLLTWFLKAVPNQGVDCFVIYGSFFCFSSVPVVYAVFCFIVFGCRMAKAFVGIY